MANEMPPALRAGLPRWRAGRTRNGWAALLFVAALSSFGCTPWREYFSNGFKVGPNFSRPPAPVAPQWIDAADARVRAEGGDLSRWWTVFRDPVLDGLIDTAYRQNLTLRDAGFRVLQARAQLAIARGGLFPQTQAMTGDYLRQAISRNAAGRGLVGIRFFDQWDWGFTLAWELDFWGRFRRLIESADETLNAQIENYDAVLVTLLGDVAANYIQVRALQQQIELTRQNVVLQAQTLTLVDARFRGGAVSNLDVEQARSILKQTEAQIPALEISLRQTYNALCVLMGMPPEDLQERIGNGDIPAVPASVVVGIPADLLRRRPDVLEAEHAAAAQSAQIGIAESDFYPHISLVGTIGYTSQALRNLVEPGSLQGSVGPTYRWNLLNYGRILNNVRYQQALFQQLVVNYQQIVLRAAEEAENGLVTFLKSQEQAQLQAESVEAAKKAVQVALVQYRGGQVDFNRVATLQLLLVQQQDVLIQARGQIATGLIDVYRALGGGWQFRLDPENPSPLPTAAPAAAPAAEPIQPPELIPAPQQLPTVAPDEPWPE